MKYNGVKESKNQKESRSVGSNDQRKRL